jgi:hypothetical protein
MVLIRPSDKQGKLQLQGYRPFVVASMIKLGVYMLLNEEEGIETTHT